MEIAKSLRNCVNVPKGYNLFKIFRLGKRRQLLRYVRSE